MRESDKILRLNEKLGRLFTPGEVAEYLKVTPTTVYTWVKLKKINCHVLSKGKRKSTVRFDIEQIQHFKESSLGI